MPPLEVPIAMPMRSSRHPGRTVSREHTSWSKAHASRAAARSSNKAAASRAPAAHGLGSGMPGWVAPLFALLVLVMSLADAVASGALGWVAPLFALLVLVMSLADAVASGALGWLALGFAVLVMLSADALGFAAFARVARPGQVTGNTEGARAAMGLARPAAARPLSGPTATRAGSPRTAAR
jgi:hypothetical protein